MTKVPPKSLIEVRAKLDDKILEASDFLCDMETRQKDQSRFTHRVSAFLSAAESVLLMMNKHAKRYAKDCGREPDFITWYEAKEDVFRTPDAARKAKKPVGSDREWVYLRAARNDTIHIERTNLAHLTRVMITTRLKLTSRFQATVTNLETGAVTVSGSEPELPAPLSEPDETKEEKDLWAFKPIEIADQGGNITAAIDAPMDDVVSVCKRHLDKLRELVAECERELSAY